MVANIMTVDLEEWFHLLELPETADCNKWIDFESRVHEATMRLLDAFAEHQVTATFFCLGWVAEKYPALLKDIVSAGHEIGCHSYHHTLVHKQDYNQFYEETKRAKELLQHVGGVDVVAYRAPGFSITENTTWAFRALIDLGFEVDSSLFIAPRAHGGWNGAAFSEPFNIRHSNKDLLELPLTPAKICGLNIPFSGGGYFRLLPYMVVRHLIEQRPYNMTYFHPRDFDQEQPRLASLGAVRKFKSYVGLSNSMIKLKKLLSEVQFLSVAQYRLQYPEIKKSIDIGDLCEKSGRET